LFIIGLKGKAENDFTFFMDLVYHLKLRYNINNETMVGPYSTKGDKLAYVGNKLFKPLEEVRKVRPLI